MPSANPHPHAAPTAALFFLLTLTLAQNLQDCYAYDGAVQSDNVVCEGSGACCNADATCTEQRLCHNAGYPPNVYIRGPCSSRSWDGSICPQICLYDEGDNLFPRVTQCDDGSWCCHQASNVNSTTCCDQGQGTFLNARGEVIDPPSSSSSSVPVSTVPIRTSSSTSHPPSASSSATSTPATSSSGASSSSDEMPTSTKIGIGVGVGVGVLALLALGLTVWFCRKKRAASRAQGPSTGYDEVRAHYAADGAEYYKPGVASPPVEALGSLPGDVHAGREPVEADAGNALAGELPGDAPAPGGGEEKGRWR